MSLDPCTISIPSFFRENGIVGLDDSCHYSKDIICPPKIALRCFKRFLSGLMNIFRIAIEFIQILRPATDKGRFLDLASAPGIKLAVSVYQINHFTLGF